MLYTSFWSFLVYLETCKKQFWKILIFCRGFCNVFESSTALGNVGVATILFVPWPLGWAASEGISIFCLHNVGMWILMNPSQILFWYKLLSTTYGPQKSEKIKVLKSKLWIFLIINWSQIEILNTFLCIPWFSFRKMSRFCNFQKSPFPKNGLKLYDWWKKYFL